MPMRGLRKVIHQRAGAKRTPKVGFFPHGRAAGNDAAGWSKYLAPD